MYQYCPSLIIMILEKIYSDHAPYCVQNACKKECDQHIFAKMIMLEFMHSSTFRHFVVHV